MRLKVRLLSSCGDHADGSAGGDRWSVVDGQWLGGERLLNRGLRLWALDGLVAGRSWHDRWDGWDYSGGVVQAVDLTKNRSDSGG